MIDKQQYDIQKQVKGNKVLLIKLYCECYLKTYKLEDNLNLLEVVMALKKKKFSNIVEIYKVKVDEKQGLIFVYEECCKSDLREMMRDNPKQFDVKEIIKCLLHVIQGLLDLKNLNIFHRDIKPDNIVYNGENYKIIDFDRAKVFGNGEIRVHTLNIGTQGYQAPEIISKQPYSYQCDVWSLGCVIHFLLFQQEIEIINNEIVIPKQNQYDDKIIKLLLKMLESNPRKRILLENLQEETKNLYKNLNDSNQSTDVEQNIISIQKIVNQPDEKTKFNTIMEELIQKEQNLQNKIYLYQFWVQRLERKFSNEIEFRQKVSLQLLYTIKQGQEGRIKYNEFNSLDQIKSQLKCFKELSKFYDF
ncbi:unnamed protein product (macronuclear) [Paramecium tetraurelia]|uniref:Protein kinase domain-containing protein n=1 Tax=Paramecium tetraurelia TaxID=5888 RepID=A0DK01_PARTE|nr:uncharacterized protein GSPATT00017712001 [Paramecium tetraurelia]CAK83368.1 unnamed protein product [Paramecium tetraurelia]|eukprot:XP_001450765.1 hypothetical protein (macronuclear) [Paramecium tetraurelia strain d4-2]